MCEHTRQFEAMRWRQIAGLCAGGPDDALDLNAPDPDDQALPLCRAIRRGAPVADLAKLLRAGASVAAREADGTTPLMAAAEAGCADAVSLLLAAPPTWALLFAHHDTLRLGGLSDPAANGLYWLGGEPCCTDGLTLRASWTRRSGPAEFILTLVSCLSCAVMSTANRLFPSHYCKC